MKELWSFSQEKVEEMEQHTAELLRENQELKESCASHVTIWDSMWLCWLILVVNFLGLE